ncbi:MAG: thiamine pyrophosphate-binding protein [Isosphaeraceae bacterium]
MTMTGADVLVNCVASHDVRHIFGMPGSHSTAIYDALARTKTIATVLARNEQAAAFMADGYARVTARPGVVCTTAGPGATNALSGIAEAWADAVPLLLLAGQVNVADLDRYCGNYHEVDLERIFQPVTGWCGTVRQSAQIPALVGQAFGTMGAGRPRTAAIFLPQDLMREPCSAAIDVLRFAPLPRPRMHGKVIAEAIEVLTKARRLVILAGGGALWADAGEEVRRLAGKLDCPIVTTLNAKGLIDERDSYSLGHARSVRARAALEHADAMLAVGCRFTEVLSDWRRLTVPTQLVQIDIDPVQIGMNYPVTVGIVADARAALAALCENLPETPAGSDWGKLWEQARQTENPRPEWLIETLRAELPEATVVFTDACELGYRMQTDWPSYAPRQFFYPSNYISLGWAFPAAVGAAVALGGPHVVSLSGDGGFLMTAQELATAVRYRLPVIALVHNDSTFGAIKNIQQQVFDGRYLDVDLNNPDFLTYAAAFGVPAHRAATAAELAEALRCAFAHNGPSLIEIPDTWRTLRDLAVPRTRARPSVSPQGNILRRRPR